MLTNKGIYQRIVAKLIHLSHTRPYIAPLVRIVSQFISDLSEGHLKAVFIIMRYLKVTLRKRIMYRKNEESNILYLVM